MSKILSVRYHQDVEGISVNMKLTTIAMFPYDWLMNIYYVYSVGLKLSNCCVFNQLLWLVLYGKSDT